jgi:hypothetical protein
LSLTGPTLELSLTVKVFTVYLTSISIGCTCLYIGWIDLGSGSLLHHALEKLSDVLSDKRLFFTKQFFQKILIFVLNINHAALKIIEALLTIILL